MMVGARLQCFCRLAISFSSDMNNSKFKKEERLCSKRLIEGLFHRGSSFLLYPYRVVFLPVGSMDGPAQVILSVSKRKFKRAHDRNTIKRRMRECYRLQKGNQFYPFLREQQLSLCLAIQYIAHEPMDYAQMYKKMEQLLNKIQHACLPISLAKDH